MKAVTAAVHISGKKFIILDYLVPDFLDSVEVGWGVICPLRGKPCNGIVLCKKESSDSFHLKELQKLVGDGPIVPKDLVELVFWIEDTYLVELSQTVGLIFPPFARGSWTECLELEAGEEELASLCALNPETGEIVDYIVKKRQFSRDTLEARFGKELTAFCIEWLLDAGLLNVSKKYRHDRTERLQGNMVMLTLEEPDLFLEENKRARKQCAVISALKQWGGQYPLEPLLQETGASKDVIRVLHDKKAVKVYNSFQPWEEDRRSDIVLTEDQQACLDAITCKLKAGINHTFLLNGVTGSGKTEVYVHAARIAVTQGDKVIVIVPEIALSSQLIRYFQKSFGHRAVVLHSKLASLERYQTWSSIRRDEVDVVIGTRSAVFAPFPHVGLIIVDEEHDKSLKQEASPRYHCLGVAAQRCRLNKGVLLQGSATPSLESFLMAKRGMIQTLEMPQRIGGHEPKIYLVDMREELRQGNTTIISQQVRNAIEDRLGKKEQVIAFINRRGYASFVNCRNCGFVFKCPHCDISLTYHARSNSLKCHYCGFFSKFPVKCPECGSSRIKAFGLGTEKVEQAFGAAFPTARILRLDSDTTTRAGAHERIVGAVAKGNCDILIGTQMVTKGFDFPGVTLVCVIAADMDLNLPDFRAEERTFQLLTQVAGRAGRREIQGEVLIQTYSPDSPGLQFLAKGKQEDFYAYELCRREELNYPPFSRFVRLLFTGSKEGEVLQVAEKTAEKLLRLQVCILGPAPAPIERIKDLYRWHLIIRNFTSDIKERLVGILEEEKSTYANKVKVIIDVDPLSIM